MIRVADYIIKKIAEENVGHIFYVPGGQCVYLMDALRRSKDVEAIGVHHEQSAAMAALSYSLMNEKMGACIVTTGCAGTNTMTGLLHAWQDSIPCIFVSGQQNYEHTIVASGLPLRQVGVQEANIVELVRPITKYAVMLHDSQKVCYEVEKAICLAKQGRKGPVWLDVPLNIQNAMIDEEKLEHYSADNEQLPQATDEEIQSVVKLLNNAKRPVMIVGHGVRSASAVGELKELLKETSIPTVFTRFSDDILADNHEMNFGVVGAAGANREANFLVQNADLVLSVGCRLSIDTTGPQVEAFAREANIIVVDIDEVEHSKKGVRIDKFVHSDAKYFLQRLKQNKVQGASYEWIEKCNHWKKIFVPFSEDNVSKESIDLKYFLRKLSDYFPEHSVILSDAGMTGVATVAGCRFKETDRLIHSFAQGEMGFVLPGALGAAASCDGMVFAITGDGSVMMNLQELQTVVRNHFNIKLIIINNNGYSGVRHGQKAHFRGKSIGTDPSNGLDFPDYGKVATAFGIDYYKISCFDEIEEGIEKTIESNKPFVLEVMCDPKQFDLHNALVTYGKRKFGFRPIEDQSPFIERDVFFEEMIVKPMETSYGEPV